jgi:predicted nuclease of restriction endonuclease-like RecB superfamily
MLSGNLVRVRFAKSKLIPQYLDPRQGGWRAIAEQLLIGFRAAPGRTRGEIYDDLSDVIGEGQSALVPRGMADLLEDRCEFEVSSDFPPDVIREAVFHAASLHRADAAAAKQPFDREHVIRTVAGELGIEADAIEKGLFADLKDERRVLTFDDCTAEFLINRYNVALAQAILLKSTAMEARIWGETPARFRQLFRQVKFHRLICTIHESTNNSYILRLDGPLSLFSATNKYGLQLAQFLPTLLHCRAFELQATVRWGTERKEKQFTLSAADGLKSHLPDFGIYTPPELQLFADSFAAKIPGWLIASDPNPVSLPDGIWVPDFKLTHPGSGKEVFVEIIGYWRKTDIQNLYKRLKKHLPGRFVLCISEQYRADKEDDVEFSEGVYRYRKTPLPEEVARAAASVAGVKS